MQPATNVRVPSPDETAESVRRAQRALAEVKQRQVVDERRANDEARDEELTRWHADDAAAEPAQDRAPAVEPPVDDRGPVLEVNALDD
jgi:hypothetical protein